MGGNQTLDDLSGGEILPRTSAIIDLPPPDTKRWVARCNAVIVNAVRSGAISLDQECHPDHLETHSQSVTDVAVREYNKLQAMRSHAQSIMTTTPVGSPSASTVRSAARSM